MMSALHRLTAVGLPLVCAAALAGGLRRRRARVPDARAQQSTYSSELSVRFETGAGAGTDKAATTVSVLGFSAVASGTDDADVLGMVDQLAADGPDQGCVLRDADVADQGARRRAAGRSISRSSRASGSAWARAPETMLHLFPRVYPDVAGVVSGVVAEAAPIR